MTAVVGLLVHKVDGEPEGWMDGADEMTRGFLPRSPATLRLSFGWVDKAAEMDGCSEGMEDGMMADAATISGESRSIMINNERLMMLFLYDIWRFP